MNNIVELLGKLKIWYMRAASYMSIVNFVMIFYLYIIESPFGLQWYHWFLFMSIGGSMLLYIDVKYIFPSGNIYTFDKSPKNVKHLEVSEENYKLLVKIVEMLENKDD